MQKLRLFWAVNLPPAVRERVYSAGGQLREVGADARWVEKDNLHVTVKFLGDTDQGMVGRLTEAATGRLQGFGKFRLAFNGLGLFPGSRNPKVLWVGLSGDLDVLAGVASALEEAMSDLGFPREARKFSPHLTLARIRSPRNVESLVRALGDGASGFTGLDGFEVPTVDLLSSTLTRSGPVYRLLARVSMGE